MINISDKVLIVTGGASGIGKATTKVFAENGATVVIADMNEEGAALAEEIRGAGGKSLFVRTNVTVEADVENLVNTTIREFGRLDGALNNAGVEQAIKPLDQLTEAEWDKVINVNLKGVFLCMKHEIKAMMASGKGGSIVNTSSTVGLVSVPFAPEYTASKAGVIGLTRATALDYAKHGIRVNSVAPGLTDAGMSKRMPDDPELIKIFSNIAGAIPMQRMGQAEEIAQAAGWLLSDASSYVTGVTLPVDGGHIII